MYQNVTSEKSILKVDLQVAERKLARKEDIHLMGWLIRYGFAHPMTIPSFVVNALGFLASRIRIGPTESRRTQENWLVRSEVQP